MCRIVRNIVPCDITLSVDALDDGTLTGRRIDCGERAVLVSHKAMSQSIRVRNVISYDLSVVADALRRCTQAGYLARARRIECREAAVLVPHEAMEHAVCI